MIPGWQKTTLGAACRIEKGKASAANEPPGMYPLITTGDGRKSAAEWQFEGPAVCVPMISAFGHGKPGLKRVHYQEGNFALANILSALLVRNPAELSAKFLAAFLNFYKDQLIVPLQFGAANMSVTVERLATVPIWFPTLPEQEKILALIDEAETLRAIRSRADGSMKQFIPSLFQKMFGDVIKNEKKWEIVPITDLSIRFSDGPFGSDLKTSHYTENGIRVIRLQNIGVGNLIDVDKAYISEEHFRSLHKHECKPGDVIVGTLGDPNLRACILPDSIPVALNKADCVQIRPNLNKASPEYICWLLNMPSTLLLAASLIQGATRARISMGRLRELFVPLPPLPLQREFAERVREARAIQSAQGRSAERIEALYQSMLARAFAGEL